MVENAKQVKCLDLQSKGLKEFPVEILKFKNLESLDLSAYDITATDSSKKYNDSIIKYAKSLPANRKEDYIVFIKGPYNRNQIKSIPKQIRKLKKLKYLNVCQTDLTKEQVIELEKLFPYSLSSIKP